MKEYGSTPRTAPTGSDSRLLVHNSLLLSFGNSGHDARVPTKQSGHKKRVSNRLVNRQIEMNKFPLKWFGFNGKCVSNRSYIVKFQALQFWSEKSRKMASKGISTAEALSSAELNSQRGYARVASGRKFTNATVSHTEMTAWRTPRKRLGAPIKVIGVQKPHEPFDWLRINSARTKIGTERGWLRHFGLEIGLA